ncbi:hypothetical protein [Dermatobacter hominis]|uniref:hypothetical protein n=1 Tax=Dermatobacter hominis TaxID=2884263 RepID=UPI001D108AC5|nr:hypothetical protein [Dermatobacter hominis]UDY35841.1 hypothetical protein LH044_21300 [Dermatobacter hominis]
MSARTAKHEEVRSTLTGVLRAAGFTGRWGLFRRSLDAEHEVVVFVERIPLLGLYRVYYSNHFPRCSSALDRSALRDHLEVLDSPRIVLGAPDMFLIDSSVRPSENPAMRADPLAPTDEIVDSIVEGLRKEGIDIAEYQ